MFDQVDGRLLAIPLEDDPLVDILDVHASKLGNRIYNVKSSGEGPRQARGVDHFRCNSQIIQEDAYNMWTRPVDSGATPSVRFAASGVQDLGGGSSQVIPVLSQEATAQNSRSLRSRRVSQDRTIREQAASGHETQYGNASENRDPSSRGAHRRPSECGCRNLGSSVGQAGVQLPAASTARRASAEESPRESRATCRGIHWSDGRPSRHTP